MSKLVEQVVVVQLMQHINSNNLDNPRQSAYKSNHSTKTLLHLTKLTMVVVFIAAHT